MTKPTAIRFTSMFIGLGCLIWMGLAALAPITAQAADAIKWCPYDEGMILGKIEKKKLYIHFYADWCRYCKKMEQDTFSDAAVVAYLNANYIPIKVNIDRERQTAAQYNIRPVPDNWFLASNGERISNQPGYIQPDLMLKILEYIHTDSYLDTSFMKFVQSRK